MKNRLLKQEYHLLLLACLISISAHAAGPEVVAKIDHKLWQVPINTHESFDEASRASILLYAQTLQDMQKMSDTDMKTAFKIKTVNRASVTKWFNKELVLSLRNYQNATKSCKVDDLTCASTIASTADLIKQAAKNPATQSAWRDNLTQFIRAYISEQMRLAALFPKVSSEIDLFNDQEWNGDAFPDRHFLLTFDDGPTNPQGDTDDTLALLSASQKSAVFFVIGENFQNRLTKTDTKTLTELYKGQCVAIHGWEHQSHAKWEKWQDSIQRTQALLTRMFPKQGVETGSFLPLFRPPYGQRRADSGAFFQQQGLQVVLWNLDSQDWNQQVNSDDIVNRMLTLMLIKRHGVLLFHDILPKARTALPILFNVLGNAVEWQDCHKI